MTLQNPFNNNFYGFGKGSIPVTDASGNILQQRPPADGMALIADSTQTTGYKAFTPTATPSILLHGTYNQSAFPITSDGTTYQIYLYGDPGIKTFAVGNSFYICNTQPSMVDVLNSGSGKNACTNGYAYTCTNATAAELVNQLAFVQYDPTSSNAQTGPFINEVQFSNLGTGLTSIQPTTHTIQYGTQVVPKNGKLTFNNIGDSITMRMNTSWSGWIVTASIGTLTITAS